MARVRTGLSICSSCNPGLYASSEGVACLWYVLHSPDNSLFQAYVEESSIYKKKITFHYPWHWTHYITFSQHKKGHVLELAIMMCQLSSLHEREALILKRANRATLSQGPWSVLPAHREHSRTCQVLKYEVLGKNGVEFLNYFASVCQINRHITRFE
jgi:hypothetical protein